MAKPEAAAENNTKEETAPIPSAITLKNGSEIDFTMKHPLQSAWTLWFDKPQKKVSQSSWSDQLKKVCTFDTVEDFWCLYNNIRPPSGLNVGSNYHLFKEGVEPKWEDPVNSGGGKWICTMPKRDPSGVSIDDLWLHTVLACIGENFCTESDAVTGAVVSMRKQGSKLALWTRFSGDKDLQMRIGTSFKQNMNTPDAWAPFGYQAHDDCLKRDSSFTNQNRYEV